MVVLISGVSGGLGSVLAKHLAHEGMRVYGTSRNPDKELERVQMLPMDISDSQSIGNCIDSILEKEGRIDAVINCVNKLLIGAVSETPMDDFQSIYETNVMGAYDLSRQLLPVFKKQGKGLIVNMSSAGGILSIPYMSAYTSSKFALEAWSEALYHELRDTEIDVVIFQPVAMHMDRPATGQHLDLSSQVEQGSKSHLMVDMMASDTEKSKLSPEYVSQKIHEILIKKGKRPLRVRLGRSKSLSMLKRIAPQWLLDKMLKQLLPV